MIYIKSSVLNVAAQLVEKVGYKEIKFVQAKPLLGKGTRVKQRASVALTILYIVHLGAQILYK